MILVVRGDVTTGGIIESPKNCRSNPPLSSGNQRGDTINSIRANNRLNSFDHQFYLDMSLGKRATLFE